jgi:hypothetical protein
MMAPYLSVPKRIFRQILLLPSGGLNIGSTVIANNCPIDLPDMHLCHGSLPAGHQKAPAHAEASQLKSYSSSQ